MGRSERGKNCNPLCLAILAKIMDQHKSIETRFREIAKKSEWIGLNFYGQSPFGVPGEDAHAGPGDQARDELGVVGHAGA